MTNRELQCEKMEKINVRVEKRAMILLRALDLARDYT